MKFPAIVAVSILSASFVRSARVVPDAAVVGCGGNMTVSDGGSVMVQSPDYTVGQYPGGLDCTWTLSPATSTHGLTISFHDFQLEAPNGQGVCAFDYVGIKFTVRKGDSEIDLMFCGNSTLPGPYSTAGQSFMLRMVTDSAAFYPGFNATCGSFKLDPQAAASTSNQAENQQSSTSSL